MSEMRSDPTQPRWVIIAENRIERPSDFEETPGSGRRATCPFCAGNESHTPEERVVYRDGQDATAPWSVRIVPNRYPAVFETHDAEADASRGAHAEGNGIAERRRPGFGIHEVIIEAPEHVASLTALAPDRMRGVLQAYRDRMRHFESDRRVAYAQLFKNVGSMAGASLEHVHSQLIALPTIPPRLAEKLREAARYHAAHDACLYCDTVARELECGTRVVTENERFVAFCPYASRFPLETWVLPKSHAEDFGRTSDADCAMLGPLLWDIFRRIEQVSHEARSSLPRLMERVGQGPSPTESPHATQMLQPPSRRQSAHASWPENRLKSAGTSHGSALTQPAYNLIMHTSPLGRPAAENRIADGTRKQHLHWHMEIVPMLVRPAGFEWGTGIHINPVSPEKAAACLRDASLG